MRWLILLLLALAMISPGIAGANTYIAIIGNDISANDFYSSPEHLQFVFDEVSYLGQEAMFFKGYEQFAAQKAVNQPEICDINGYTEGGTAGPRYFSDYGQPNAVTRKGSAGWYEWYIRLPAKPSGEINLVLQSGILKPGAFSFFYYDAITICAAETGERVGPGLCTRQEIDPGINPLIVGALPRITAKAFPGKYNIGFNPFNLTAFKNPGTYNPFINTPGVMITPGPIPGSMVNGDAAQLLDGTDVGTKILLKACMDTTIVTKLPVTGQINAAGDMEADLEYGDLIYVRLDIPRSNTVDIYCHEQSLRVMGIGESWY